MTAAGRTTDARDGAGNRNGEANNRNMCCLVTRAFLIAGS